MEPQFAYVPARGGGGGHGDTDAEEMQHMWQFLDAALPTPPTAAHAPPPPVAAASAPMGAVPMPPGEPDEALNDDENGMYNELGDVFNNLLFFGMDPADEQHATQHPAQHPAQLMHGASPPGMPMNPAHAAHVRYSEQGGNNNAVDVTGPSSATLMPSAAGGDGASASQKVQLPRSASVSSSHSGVDSISPVGLLGYPSMSPATINWLQSLASSASSESLTGLISPATLYSGSASITPSAVSGSAGGLPGSTGPLESGKGGNLPRTPSCEMIDWKAYNEAVGMAERTQKEPAKWRVIPQHGPHADPAATISSFPGSVGGPPPEHHHTSKPDNLPGAAPHERSGRGHSMAMSAGAPPSVEPNVNDAEGGLRTHLTRQFETIKSTVVSIVGGALGAPGSPSSEAAARANGADASFQSTTAPTSSAMSGRAHLVRPPAAGPAIASSLSAQEQMQLTAKRMAEEKNKRKAIISPEYVQYGNTGSSSGNPALFGIDSNVVKIEGDMGQMQFATEVPDPTGRRPSKKSLHQAGAAPSIGPALGVGGAAMVDAASSMGPISTIPTSHSSMSLDTDASSSPVAESAKDEGGANPALIRCKCTGKCRNARCACVKAGLVCGVHCKCVSCANPFVPMEKEGIDIQKMVKDVCLMQYLSKVKDMQELLDSTVAYECCDGVVQVKHTIESGFTCPHCQAHYTYSWCSNKLCHDQKKPRKHCAKCRRCGDHRNEHCDDCNHCYFAGVANSFSCSCKSGKPVTGSGVKARSIVPNVNRDADNASSSSTKSSSSPPDLFGTRDENANGSNLPAGSSSFSTQQAGATDGSGQGTVAAGLSGPDNEGDDSCKMQ